MKAIITDLDRTILHTDKTLSEYTIHILQKCHEKGIAVMAATARPERAVLPYQAQAQFDAITTLNGARVLLPDRVHENGIPHASAELILSKLTATPDVLISVETSDGLYASAEIPEWNPIVFRGFPKLPTEGTLYKILASSENPTLYKQLQNILTDDTYYTIAVGSLVQIMGKDATKWNGVKAMLEYHNIPRSEAVYFGDDNDDIEPIKMCGCGVAVSNAIEDILKEADVVAGSNDEDGVAKFIAGKLGL